MMSTQKYILVDVVAQSQPKAVSEKNLEETLSLIDTLRSGKVVKVIQKRDHPHPGTFIGSGKAEELIDIIKKYQIDVVIINTIAKSTQLFNLLSLYWPINPMIEVWDRVDLILHIFAKHARTAEAKLQIKLAQMHHMGPRMYGLSEELGRQSGGIGGRGVGETNVELMKRHWRDQIKSTKEQLVKYVQGKQQQLDRRRRTGLKTVSIVGYTNAGKTTLFNILANTAKDRKVKATSLKVCRYKDHAGCSPGKNIGNLMSAMRISAVGAPRVLKWP